MTAADKAMQQSAQGITQYCKQPFRTPKAAAVLLAKCTSIGQSRRAHVHAQPTLLQSCTCHVQEAACLKAQHCLRYVNSCLLCLAACLPLHLSWLLQLFYALACVTYAAQRLVLQIGLLLCSRLPQEMPLMLYSSAKLPLRVFLKLSSCLPLLESVIFTSFQN